MPNFTPDSYAEADDDQGDLCRFFAAVARNDGDTAKAELCESQAAQFDAAAEFWRSVAA